MPLVIGKRQRPVVTRGGHPGVERKNTPRIVGTLTGDAPTAPHLYIKIAIKLPGDRVIYTKALLDCGANGNYLDQSFQKLHQIPVRNRSCPEQAMTVDDSLLKSGQIVKNTTPLSIVYQEVEKEEQFDIIQTPTFKIILGMPWLLKWNPVINWRERTVVVNKPGIRHINAITDRYPDLTTVFDKKEAEVLPPHREYDCKIDLLPNTSVPHGRIYALSPKEDNILKDYIKTNLEKGFIRTSSSPAGAPLFFVSKKDTDELRPCIDFRLLNLITVKNRYPLPLIPVLLDQIQNASIFSKVDLRGAYNLVRMREGDEWKTAFRTAHGHFEYLVMPFGLCNAPACFQFFVNDVFHDILNTFMIIYLDDILIFSNSEAEHNKHVRMVLERLLQHRLYAKESKCMFFQRQVPFLGYLISHQGREMDPGKVQAILQWEAPQNTKDVQRFLGFANFYRQYIISYSEIVLPLTWILKKKGFFWGDEQQKAFDTLKQEFTKAPVLAHPDFTQPFIVEADASANAIGAVLSQKDALQNTHPIAYYSRKLSSAERNYTIYERELLAIKEALKQWRHYLEGTGNPITVYTDHKNLEFLKNLTCQNGRQARWSLFFSRFDYTITYKPGSCNARADALSRSFTEEEKEVTLPTPILSPQRVIGATGVVMSSFLQEVKDSYTVEGKNQFLSKGTMAKEIEGLLFYGSRLWVPSITQQTELMQWCHESPLAGHPGPVKTLELLSRYVWWAKMRKTVEEYVLLCPICAKTKSSHLMPQGLLQPLKVPEGPWKTMAMDFITDLPKSKGCTVVLVVTDLFTKMAHFISLTGLPTAKVLAIVFLEQVVRLHGIPDVIVSDRGSQFISKFWKEFNSQLGTKLVFSSGYHPQTDGSTERCNQTLEQYLRVFCMHDEKNWAHALPIVEFLYNNSYHSAVKTTPFCALMGYHPSFLPSRFPSASLVPEVSVFLRTFASRVRVLTILLLASKAAMKEQADKHRRDVPTFLPGEKVWLSTKNFRFKGNTCNKLSPRYIGPYEIEKVMSPLVLKLKLPPSIKCHPVFHVSQVKVYTPKTRPDMNQVQPHSDSKGEYQVAKILDSRLVRGKLQYLIDWVGYGPEDRSWEPVANVHAPQSQAAFHAKQPDKPKPAGWVPGGGGTVRNPALRRPLPRTTHFRPHSVHSVPRGRRLQRPWSFQQRFSIRPGLW